MHDLDRDFNMDKMQSGKHPSQRAQSWSCCTQVLITGRKSFVKALYAKLSRLTKIIFEASSTKTNGLI